MSLFVVFIVAAVLLGAGAMLSPAWRTAQPRIALAATLCLALVTGGAVFYTEAFGWDTLVIDYLLFALLSGVVLGGTLSSAQARAEARGEQLEDRDQGWPGPEDLAFFALAALIVILPLFHLPAPLGTQGQVTALHSLATREGESFSSLAPFAAGANIVIAPGFHALSAYLSLQLDHTIPLIQLSVAAVVLLLLVWLAYDLGAELQGKRLGRAMALALLLSFGAFTSYLDGHFSELLALLFTAAFLLYALRLLRRFHLADLVAGGLMMGAVIYTNVSLSLVMGYALLALLGVAWLYRPSAITRSSRLGLTIGLPAVALLGIAPWLANNLPLMLPISPSPYAPNLSNLAHITRAQGLVIMPLALYGMWRGLQPGRPQRPISMMMCAWLVLVIDAAVFGLVGSLLPSLAALTNAPNIARHGVVLPYTYFGGLALLHLWDEQVAGAIKRRLRPLAYRLMALAAGLILLAGVSFQPLLDLARPLLDLPPASITEAELAAMSWLREKAPKDALLLAADGNAWLPVFAERRSVDLRAVKYFEWELLERPDVDLANASYILWSSGDALPIESRLNAVFEVGKTQLYEVMRNHGAAND